MKRTYIFVVALLTLIYMVPNMLFYMEDHQREQTITPLQKQPLVQMDVENMYLVNQLHFLDYQGMDYVYDESFQKQRHIELEDEVKKMKEFDLISEDTYEKFTSIQSDESYKTYIFHRLYSYEESYISNGNITYVGNILMEAKTNKIVRFHLISEEPIASDEVIMKKYIKYLGLDVVDDWELVEEDAYGQQRYMASQKAQLKVYTNTERILISMDDTYQTMYRILYQVDTLNNVERLLVN